MKSDVIIIDNQGNGFDAALVQTKKSAAFREISHGDCVILQLMTEELLSMAHSVTGEMQASFWVESEGMEFRLNLTTDTVMDKEKRRLLLDASTSRKNEAASSFLGKLRDKFEEAMTAEPVPGDDLPQDVMADLAGRVFDDPDWDKYEQSVLSKIADNIQIGIRGGHVTMAVIKKFQ